MGMVIIFFVFPLAPIALIIMGILNLASAKQQASVMQQTSPFIGKSKSVSTNATKAGWIKISIGAAIIWVGVIFTVIWILF